MAADRMAGHSWLLLAANRGNPVAATELTALEKTMSAANVEMARAAPAPAVDVP